jgi:hypothetical protein
MANYQVNVRAVVVASTLDPEASGHIEGWEIYDYDALDRDDNDLITRARIRCDQQVTVEADNQSEAIDLAKADATAIVVEGFEIESVDLWVDEGIDIELVQEAVNVSGPKV